MKTKALLTRFIAGLVVSALLVFAADTLIPDTSPKKTFFEELTGISHSTVIAKVKEQPVTWEEFLYLVAYDADSLAQYIEQIGWDADVGGTTLREYVKSDALEACKLYAVVRQYADFYDIGLTAENEADLAAYHKQLTEQLGGKEAYRRQMYLMGLSDEGLRRIDSMEYLYQNLLAYATQPGSQLRPDDQTLLDYADRNGYRRVKVLYLPGDAENAETVMSGYARTLRGSADPAADFAALCTELGLEDTPLSVKLDEIDPALGQIIESLQPGEISDAVPMDAGYYVIWRLDTDLDTVSSYFFGDLLNAAVSEATPEPVGTLLESFDPAEFYTRFSTIRANMISSLNAAG